jgi:hypothetical protein
MLDIVIRVMMVGKVMLMLKARGIMKSAKGGYWAVICWNKTSIIGRWCLRYVQVFALVGRMHKITI